MEQSKASKADWLNNGDQRRSVWWWGISCKNDLLQLWPAVRLLGRRVQWPTSKREMGISSGLKRHVEPEYFHILLCKFTTRGEFWQTNQDRFGEFNFVEVKLNVVCFYNVSTRSLSWPKFSEIVKLEFRRCMVWSKKNNCQNCHFAAFTSHSWNDEGYHLLWCKVVVQCRMVQG